MPAKIGLYGGTFNPVHCGHTRAAEMVSERLALDRVFFIPSYIPPHKMTADIASPSDRLNMIRIAVAGHPKFFSSSIEIKAREKSYSIITIRKMRSRFPRAELYFILGVDAWLEIDTWKDYDRVLKECKFIVASRPGYSLAAARNVHRRLSSESLCELSGSESVGRDIPDGCSLFLIEMDALDVSSTEIRNRIKRGEPLSGMVDPGVESYIKEHSLYL